MKRLILLCILLTFFLRKHSKLLADGPEAVYKQAQEFSSKKQYYSLAYPLTLGTGREPRQGRSIANPFTYENVHYYNLVCSLNQDDSTAVNPAMVYIERDK
jgi:hypothetical protein